MEFDAANDVRMMSDHDVCASVDGGVSDSAFIRGEPRGRVHDSLVERNDHQCVVRACTGDVVRQVGK